MTRQISSISCNRAAGSLQAVAVLHCIFASVTGQKNVSFATSADRCLIQQHASAVAPVTVEQYNPVLCLHATKMLKNVDACHHAAPRPHTLVLVTQCVGNCPSDLSVHDMHEYATLSAHQAVSVICRQFSTFCLMLLKWLLLSEFAEERSGCFCR